MELTPAQIRYLLAVYRLGGPGPVRSAAVAAELSVTRPSAHRMLGQLAELGLLSKKKYARVALTEGGRDLAEKYHHSFLLICALLREGLNLAPVPAGEAALAALCSLGWQQLEAVLPTMR